MFEVRGTVASRSCSVRWIGPGDLVGDGLVIDPARKAVRAGLTFYPNPTSRAYQANLDDPWRALCTLLAFGFDPQPFPEVTGEVPEPPPEQQPLPGFVY